MIKCIIFDMDGLMLETGRLAYRAYIRSAEKYNYEFNYDVYNYLTGRTNEDIIEEMKSIYGDENPILLWRQEMVENKHKIVCEEKRVYKKKGLVELLEYLQQKQIPYCMASSNTSAHINEYLKLEGLLDSFKYIVSGESVHHGKPDPDIFLQAVSLMNEIASECLVLEDSSVGIEAAIRAGCRNFQVIDKFSDLPAVHGIHRVKTNITKFNDNSNYSAERVLSSLLDVIPLLEEEWSTNGSSEKGRG
mgnify:CR=1 FL=1